MTTVGVLTAGGDCPGLNAVIRAVVARAGAGGADVIGIEEGWAGLAKGRVRRLDRDDVRGILTRGGTILGTSRLDPYLADGPEPSERVAALGLDSLIVVGGDGSLRSAARLAGDGVAVVGVPKTIDNDIGGTDYTFGFDTAVQVATDAIDRLTTTAESHNRIMIVEVMGRTAGWIAAHAGIAGGAEAILVPEVTYDIGDIARRISARHEKGSSHSIVVVAEGVPAPAGEIVYAGVDEFGFKRLGGVANDVASTLEDLTGYETRVTVLGYLQRGGTPTAFDRVLATRFGLAAAEAALAGRSGIMVAVRGGEIVEVDLAEACSDVRQLPRSRYEDASWFFA